MCDKCDTKRKNESWPKMGFSLDHGEEGIVDLKGRLSEVRVVLSYGKHAKKRNGDQNSK